MNNLCGLYGSGFQSLDWRYCYDYRKGLEKVRYTDIENDWHSAGGQSFVAHWPEITEFWKRQKFFQDIRCP